jgi:diguanylate cyclase (GGDEF)-like protein
MSTQPRDPPQRPAGPQGGASASGVLSRLAFEEHLLREWERARHAQAPLSLLLIDIDHFRANVDLRRASQGDERLKKIAGTLGQAVFRPTDLVARYGDDAFAILLPAVHEEGARVVAARVRSLVNALALPHSGGEGGIVTVSVGVAALEPAAGGRPQQLVDLCERALQEARRMGPDSIVSQDWMV